MTRSITPRTTLDNLRKDAKAWLKALRDGDPEARARLAAAWPGAPRVPVLRDVQRAVALEFGCSGWTALKERPEQDAPLRRYDRVADALVQAYASGDESSLRVVWEYFGHQRTLDAMRRYVRLDLGRAEQPDDPDPGLGLDAARSLVARAQGFESWTMLEAYAATLRPRPTLVERLVEVGGGAGRSEKLRSRDWDEVLEAITEHELTALNATGQMTDAVLERVSDLDHLTDLDLSGSKALTDHGLRHLARLPGLTRLNLSGCTGLSDAGLDVLRQLPALESLSLAWTRIGDAGLAGLAVCEQLQRLDVSGTMTGDRTIAILAGKPHLRDFRSGNGVTDAGLEHLQALPVFTAWRGFDPDLWITQFAPDASFLMLRGTFTDRGLAHLAKLPGLFGLNVDDSRLAITGAGLRPLASLPHFGWLAFDATDDSMPDIAALPHLRFLMCQDTTAGDDGFTALSRSRTIEYLWGRRCHNLRRAGFTALAGMPALRGLSVSCLNVDDEGVSALPRFPALRELMPMDIPDEGFRHIGRCDGLESLVLMYCRDTGDRATEHLRELPRLRKYFASYTQISDRTPELLGGMASLEEVTFDTCAGLTSQGIAALARLPNLRSLRVSGMPNVTPDVAAAFPPRVRVSHGW